MKKIKP